MSISLSPTGRQVSMQNRSAQAAWQHAEIHLPEQILPLAQHICQEMTEAGYTEKDIFCLRLAVEEAIVNGIKHGNGADPVKRVLVRYTVSAGETIVEIEDEGIGFDPEAIPDPLAPENIEKPSGRGIFLMRFYMSSVKYNERGNRVTLCRANSACCASHSAND